MATFGEKLLREIRVHPGLSDRELTTALKGREANQQHVNQEARYLEQQRLIIRQQRNDGLIGNYPAEGRRGIEPPQPHKIKKTEKGLSEDELKDHLASWLKQYGWEVVVAWGKSRGVDIDAKRKSERWIIEVKGIGSLNAMRVNYFIGILGETLQRMDDENAKYSIALPDIAQFRNLWARLPSLAKKRTQISALFVSGDGSVRHEHAIEA